MPPWQPLRRSKVLKIRRRQRQSPPTASASQLDPRSANPFPVYDRETSRLRAHLRSLKTSQWSVRSHCRGWSVKDIVAHLSTDEVYNQACLDGTLRQLPLSGGLNGWNGRGVRIRRGMSPLETLQEWYARQERVRRAGREIDLDLETFIAYLTNRPQQLKDANQRALVRRLVA